MIDDLGPRTSDPGPRLLGRVKWFNDKKGYGFIEGPDGVDYFVHHSAIAGPGWHTLLPEQPVEFSLAPDPHGRGPRAVEVVVLEDAA